MNFLGILRSRGALRQVVTSQLSSALRLGGLLSLGYGRGGVSEVLPASAMPYACWIRHPSPSLKEDWMASANHWIRQSRSWAHSRHLLRQRGEGGGEGV